MKNWFKRGFDEGSKVMEEERKAKSTGTRSAAGNRFWMPKDSDKNLVFLTDEPFLFMEHQWKENGNWRNWATCLEPLGLPCQRCDDDSNRYQVAAFTVVDCSPWKDKEGKEHRFTKRLFMAKSGIWEKIERERGLLQEDGNTLRGAAFRVFRGKDDKSPGVGEDFKFRKMIDLDNWEFTDIAEYDYAELFAPKLQEDEAEPATTTYDDPPF